MKKSLIVFFLFFLLIFAIVSSTASAQQAPLPPGDEEEGIPSSSMINSILDTSTPVPDLFSGTMGYSIPLLVPEGRKGLAPKLVLSYQSTQQNSWLGIGWELEVGSIERNTRKGIGFNGDNYLLRINGSTMELVAVDNNGTYESKIENGFLKIKKLLATDGNVYWEVTDKTGIRYFLGRTADTRQDDPGDATHPADPNKIFKWCLERVEDPNGNYMTFSYAKSVQNQPYVGQIYLDHIEYTGNVNGALPTNYVKFHLETRTDAPDMYSTNFKAKTAFRLKTIEVRANGALQWAYGLDYDTNPSTTDVKDYSPNTGRSILTIVQKYGKDATVALSGAITGGTSLPAIQLGLPVATDGFTITNKSAMQLNPSSAWLRPGDFDGDGKTDIMSIKTTGWGSGELYIHYAKDGDADPAHYMGLQLNGDPKWVKLGDFDGDGKTDIMSYHVLGWGNSDIYIHYAKDGFINPAHYTGLQLNIYPEWIYLGDFDGDGKTDIMSIKTTGWGYGEFYIHYAKDGFTNPAYYTGLRLNNTFSWSRVGDFDGDGKMDILSIHETGWGYGDVYIHYAKDGFTNPAHYMGLQLNAKPQWTTLGDFNGDGKADIMSVYDTGWGTASFYVNYATGNGFNSGHYTGLQLNEQPQWTTLGDFNGDGKADIMSVYDTGWGTASFYVNYATGNGFNSGHYTGMSLNGTSQWLHLGDLDGDGRMDILSVHEPGWGTGDIYISHINKSLDLLSRITNGLGGTTTINYTPSTQYSNTQLPFPIQTVSSVATNDGHGIISTSTYTYSGGFYHIAERDFRGFNHAIVTGPAGLDGKQKVTETWFHQGNDTSVISETATKADLLSLATVTTGYMKGKPYRTRVKDETGKIYSETTTSYLASSSTGTTAAYFNPTDEVSTYICDGSTSTSCDSATSGQSKKVKYLYDSYGNVTSEQTYNSATASAPYKTTVRSYTIDSTNNYMVGLPKDETILDGSGAQVSKTTYYYDDPSDCGAQSRTKNQLPIHGNVTTIVQWLNPKPAGITTDPETNISYDNYGYGNPVCMRDANNNLSRILYDTDSNTYAKQKSNHKGHVTTTRYYGVEGVSLENGLYGQVASVTDPNLAVTTTEYDALGRKTKVIDPYGGGSTNGTVSYSYHDENLGTVGQQRITTTTTLDYSTNATTWKEDYFDGFGKTIKTRALGADSKVVVTTTTYEPRGAVAQSSLPYFENNPGEARMQTFNYDSQGRVTQTTKPDPLKPEGATTLFCYLNGVKATINPDGNKKRETKDVLGRLVQVNEYDPSTPFTSCSTGPESPYATTTYQYDAKDNLRFVTDAENNQTEMRYDSLGHKIYMNDPDMGQWNYVYDLNGNLKSQTDAKNQTIGFTYDSLNRVILKSYPTGTNVAYVYDEPFSTNPIGKVTTMIDASGTTTYYYDLLGRTTRTTKLVDNNAANPYTINTSYNAIGKPKSITYPDGETLNYAYNTGGLVSAITGTVSNFATYANYNALNQVGSIAYANGISTTYQYYPENYRLQSIVTGNGTQAIMSLSYKYYPGGNISDIIDYVNSALTQWFEYDGLDRIRHAQTPNGPSYGGVNDLFYNYTLNGNINYKENVNYDYSSTACTSGKPHAVKVIRDSNGNLKASYCYDLNGNMVSEVTSTVTTRTISYNYDNMPQSVTANNATTNFVYDGNNTRVKKSTPAGDNIYIGKLYECKDNVCTKYVFNGDTRVAMKTGNDVSYYHQDHLGSTQVVTQTNAAQGPPCSAQPVLIAGTVQYFDTLQAAYNAALEGAVILARAGVLIESPNFSSNKTVTIRGGYDCSYTSPGEPTQVVGMMRDSSGKVTIKNFRIVVAGIATQKVEEVRYKPFGETITDTGTLSVTHKYTSQEFDAETGLYNYNARFYNPVLGRFISADSIVPDIANPQSLNRYSYVLNNPHHYTDPTGHCGDDGSGCWGWMNDYPAAPNQITIAQAQQTGWMATSTAADLVSWGFYSQSVNSWNRGEYASSALYGVAAASMTAVTALTWEVSVPARAATLAGERFFAGEGGTLLGSTTTKGGLGGTGTWGRAETLSDHFGRHGADFGAKTAEGYAEMASQFLRRSQVEGLSTKIDSRGVIRVYDELTNTFGAYNPNGTTRTFYAPNPSVHGFPTNIDYWRSLSGGAPWRP